MSLSVCLGGGGLKLCYEVDTVGQFLRLLLKLINTPIFYKKLLHFLKEYFSRVSTTSAAPAE